MFDPVLNLVGDRARQEQAGGVARRHRGIVRPRFAFAFVALVVGGGIDRLADGQRLPQFDAARAVAVEIGGNVRRLVARQRSEEHTSELPSLMRISYAVFCLKKKK